MRKVLLGSVIAVALVVIILACNVIPGSVDRADCRLITGKVERIGVDSNTGGGDIRFYLSGTNKSYYINRGVEQKLPVQNWQKQLTNNDVSIAYYKNSIHICELVYKTTVLYSEFNNDVGREQEYKK